MKKDNGEDMKGVLNKKKLRGDEKERLSLYANNSDNYAQPPRKYKKRAPFVPSLMGRPKEFPDDHPVWVEIIDQMTEGKSLSSVIKAQGMPVWSTVQLRIATDEKYRERYDKAIQDRADRLADEILELADEPIPEDAGAGANAWVQQKRLQVDARKWIASKLKPRTYGDRLDVSVTDNRISVLGALEQAQQRVALGMSKESNVLDVEIKTVEKQGEVVTTPLDRMNAQMSE